MEVHGNRQIKRLYIGLDRVGVGHRVVHIGHRAVEGPHAGVYALLHIIGEVGAASALGGQQQQAGNLIPRHLAGQIRGAGVRVQPPVLIGVQLAVFIHILEGVPAGLEQLHAGVGGVAQGGPALVGHLHPALGGLLLGPLHVAGAQLFQFPGRYRLGGSASRVARRGGRGALRRGGAFRVAVVAARQQGQQHGRRQRQAARFFQLHFHCET